ncbi:hypothetical protein BC939DRAFT_502853 [Gamsiella multidivaricata]|uniref:uncharacterized protein n=1 Tax=Gamsiella multidivaricata TaxID=101098 RepID=UPI00221FF075|nr:uncharacterized protein BC939DRAFT_502853 [Gamsiella multidivaricata]KAI7824041.1 hypothetical protein BC939DRAFT_502853 [Gamsiella multidivaricata]
MSFRYQDVGNTRNCVETVDIKAMRRHYLQERRSDKYKDAIRQHYYHRQSASTGVIFKLSTSKNDATGASKEKRRF